MANFVLIFICLFLGFLGRRTKRLPPSTPVVLNSFIIGISLPALALLHLHDVKLSRDTLYPAVMAWLLFALGAVFFTAMARVQGWRARVLGALMMTGAMGNTSFVGFPLLEAFYGKDSLAVGIITDQAGSFLVLSTLGIAAASLLSVRKVSASGVLSRILGFPPLYAMLLAFALRSVTYPDWVSELLEKLSATLVPLALVSVGFQLEVRRRGIGAYFAPLGTGLFYKLILGPACLALFFIGILGARGEAIQITVTQAAMAPMITGAIIADDYGLEPELANLMIGVGIPLSLITVPLWVALLRHLAA